MNWDRYSSIHVMLYYLAHLTLWKIVCVIVGEYEQRAVFKRYNVVDNGPGNVFQTFGVIYCCN